MKRAARAYVPAVARRAVRRLRGLPVDPVVGHVRFGDLRRVTPIDPLYGFDRGGPVDRRYIEGFLGRHRADVRGRVLEFGDSTYTRQFGDDRVTQADAMHVDPTVPGIAFAGDLAGEPFLPDAAFDCIICTQVLHLVYDFPAALRAMRRALAPGGVLLLTAPGVTKVDEHERGSTWHYSFSHHAIEEMCRREFPEAATTIESHGNVLVAVSFLMGLGQGDLRDHELDAFDVEYAVVNCARVVMP